MGCSRRGNKEIREEKGRTEDERKERGRRVFPTACLTV